jgi:drug/metabolite transporter (DMT)-like permease
LKSWDSVNTIRFMKNPSSKAIAMAIAAALLYSLSSPISKVLLGKVEPTMMASLLYLGCGLGLAGFKLIAHPAKAARLGKEDLGYTIAMVALDIAAPICLLIGLNATSAANASLLNNFEIVATSLIALLIFKEAISPRLWLAIALVSVASFLLGLEDAQSLKFSKGSLFVLLAAVLWGFENNCTRMLSAKDPLQIVIIKGLGSGTGSFIIAMVLGQKIPDAASVLWALLLGFAAYGLSIYLYVSAQRYLGAAKTSAYYAFAPFMGSALSFAIFAQRPTAIFLAALSIMALGAYLAAKA